MWIGIFPFVFVVGTYNTKGKPSEMAEAYMNWQNRPLVADGLQLGGGVTKHDKGAGPDLEFFGAFKTMVDFATSISTQGTVNTAARNSFWSLADGPHARSSLFTCRTSCRWYLRSSWKR